MNEGQEKQSILIHLSFFLPHRKAFNIYEYVIYLYCTIHIMCFYINKRVKDTETIDTHVVLVIKLFYSNYMRVVEGWLIVKLHSPKCV